MSIGTNYLVTTLSCNPFTAVDVDTATFKFLMAAVGLLEFVTAVACDLRISSNLVDGPTGCDVTVCVMSEGTIVVLFNLVWSLVKVTPSSRSWLERRSSKLRARL